MSNIRCVDSCNRFAMRAGLAGLVSKQAEGIGLGCFAEDVMSVAGSIVLLDLRGNTSGRA